MCRLFCTLFSGTTLAGRLLLPRVPRGTWCDAHHHEQPRGTVCLGRVLHGGSHSERVGRLAESTLPEEQGTPQDIYDYIPINASNIFHRLD